MHVPVTTAFLSGSPGPGELIVIFLVILVLFGPRRLPEIARMIGKTLTDLRRASQDFRDQIMTIDEKETGEPIHIEPDYVSVEDDECDDEESAGMDSPGQTDDEAPDTGDIERRQAGE